MKKYELTRDELTNVRVDHEQYKERTYETTAPGRQQPDLIP